MTNEIIKFLLSTMEFTAMILLVLSMFRIYFRYAWHKVIAIAVILSAISIYIRDILGQFDYGFLSIFITEIVLITLFFRLPVIFAFFMSIIGNVATAVFEMLTISVGTQLGLTSVEQMDNSLIHLTGWYLTVTFLQLVFVFFLQRYKVGFHFTINDALKRYNFWLSAILVISVFAMQVQVLALRKAYYNIAFPIILGIIFLIGIFLSYIHNQKLWKARRERLSKK